MTPAAPDVGSSPTTPIDASGALGRLGLTLAQRALLGVVMILITAVAGVGYVSNDRMSDQTEALNYQLQRVSGDRVSLQRQVLTFALGVGRWADELVTDDELTTQRALVERQRRITHHDAAGDPRSATAMARVDESTAAVDRLVATGRPVPGSAARAELATAVDTMVGAAKRLVDIDEDQNFALVHQLADDLRSSRRAAIVAAVLIGLIVVLLVVSMQRMARTNYRAAALILRREQARYEEARAAQVRVESQHREVVDEVTDVVFRCDAAGRWTQLNQAWVTLTGIEIADALGRPAIVSWHRADRAPLAAAIADLIAGRRAHVSDQFRLLRADGAVRLVVIAARVTIDDVTGDLLIAGTLNDVTARVEAERLTVAQTEILELVALDTPMRDVLDRIVELMEPHAAGTRLRFVTGSESSDPAASGAIRLSDLSRGGAIGLLEWTASPATRGRSELEPILRMAARLGALAIDRQLAADRMVHQANHDVLTGLPNRTLLVERIDSAIARSRRHDSRVALMFLDIDRFKVVNDSLGHTAGDRLLVEVATRLAATVRPGDTVARFGGDEFVVLLEDVDAVVVGAIAERILTAIAAPVELGGQVAHVSTSIGIVHGSQHSTPDQLLKNADVAMYRAKQTGRARYELFDAEMERWAAHRHATETDLRRSVTGGELEVWYQPVIQLMTGRLTGFEALVRWNRPGVGIVAPAEFIGLAEEIGIIDEIGAAVLDRAVHQLARWQRVRAGITVSVNVSGRELTQEGFAGTVSSTLDRAGADVAGLVLEITESVLLEDAHDISHRLAGLRSLGLRVAIDDFGTGYSSLRYLRNLPVDILKIDRTFVSASDSRLNDATIVASVTDLGHALGLEIVAEGIETVDQLRALRAMGVDSGQGYLFGRPMPVDDAHAMLLAAAQEPRRAHTGHHRVALPLTRA